MFVKCECIFVMFWRRHCNAQYATQNNILHVYWKIAGLPAHMILFIFICIVQHFASIWLYKQKLDQIKFPLRPNVHLVQFFEMAYICHLQFIPATCYACNTKLPGPILCTSQNVAQTIWREISGRLEQNHWPCILMASHSLWCWVGSSCMFKGPGLICVLN